MVAHYGMQIIGTVFAQRKNDHYMSGDRRPKGKRNRIFGDFSNGFMKAQISLERCGSIFIHGSFMHTRYGHVQRGGFWIMLPPLQDGIAKQNGFKREARF